MFLHVMLTGLSGASNSLDYVGKNILFSVSKVALSRSWAKSLEFLSKLELDIPQLVHKCLPTGKFCGKFLRIRTGIPQTSRYPASQAVLASYRKCRWWQQKNPKTVNLGICSATVESIPKPTVWWWTVSTLDNGGGGGGWWKCQGLLSFFMA